MLTHRCHDAIVLDESIRELVEIGGRSGDEQKTVWDLQSRVSCDDLF